jgi:hypothetical protein
MRRTQIVDCRAFWKAIFQPNLNRRKNMEKTVYNPQKGRLETINIDFTDENTTWFDDCEDSHGILSITDLQGGILIKEADYTYPLYVYDISRADIGHDHGQARALHRQYIDK